jgi:Tol biopolymer transport system component
VQLTHTDEDHAALYPDIAPNGRQVAFTLIAFDGAVPRTWIMNADGSNPHQLTGDAPDIGNLQPRFTPDGRHIVFARCGDVCAIWIMDRDGTHKRAITPFVSPPTNEHVDFDPAVSPDGSQIAFSRFFSDGINVRVFVADIDGGHERAITPAWLEAGDPTYVGHGSQLAFQDNLNRLGASIWRAGTDGSGLRRLTDRPYPNLDYAASGSPDSTRIGFASDRRYDDFCCGDIFTMRTDGSDERRVPTGNGLGVADLEWGLSPTTGSAQTSRAAVPGSRGMPCPGAPGSLRLVPCAAAPAALAHWGPLGPSAKGRRSG